MGVLGISIGDSVRWIADRFPVPNIKPGRPVGHRGGDSVLPYRVGVSGSELEVLVRSGMFGELSHAEKDILVILYIFRDPASGLTRMSYAAIGRYAGVGSSATISQSLERLARLHAIQVHRGARIGVTRECNAYRVTLDDPGFYDACNAIFQKARAEIAHEREYRAQLRQARQRLSPRQLNTRTGGREEEASSLALRAHPFPESPTNQSQQTYEGLDLSSMGEVISNKTLHALNRETDFDADLIQKHTDDTGGENGGESPDSEALRSRPVACASSCYEIEPGRWIHHPWNGCTTIKLDESESRPKVPAKCLHKGDESLEPIYKLVGYDEIGAAAGAATIARSAGRSSFEKRRACRT
jgi:hypothetical protein